MTINLAELKYDRRSPTPIEIRPPKGNEDVLVQKAEISPALALLKIGTKWYWVLPEIHKQIPEDQIEFASCTLACVVGADNTKQFILWPLKEDIPSALEAATLASDSWIRVVWEKRSYNVHEASADRGSVEWPYATVDEAVEAAFKGRIISTLDHPALKELVPPK